MISVSLLEHAVREDLNAIATRAMAVINPVKVVITNYPEGQTETVEMENNPEDPQAGTHSMPFSREIYIERDDFMENPPKSSSVWLPVRKCASRVHISSNART